MKKLLVSLVMFGVVAYPSMAMAQTIIYGTSGDDVIHANQTSPRGAQTLYGLQGDDRIWGGKGNDTVFGGNGDDRLHSYHAGKDTLNGGRGWDICVIAKDSPDVVISCEVVRYRHKQGNGR